MSLREGGKDKRRGEEWEMRERRRRKKKDVSSFTDAEVSHDEERRAREALAGNRDVHSSAARERLSFSWHLRAE